MSFGLTGDFIYMNTPNIIIIPKRMHRELRLYDLRKAISQYLNDHKAIPMAWVTEHNELISELAENDRKRIVKGERK